MAENNKENENKKKPTKEDRKAARAQQAQHQVRNLIHIKFFAFHKITHKKIKTSEDTEIDYASQFYGNLPLIQSKERIEKKLHNVSELNETIADQKIWVRGRLFTSRSKGKQCFFVIRQRFHTIQALLSVNDAVSKKMVKFAAE